MNDRKILYVDDEPIALKYFERLVGPLAPVLTAQSVEEGRQVLLKHSGEIAVLVCDQRMPGERGTELLRHARQHYPAIVRLMTTAYSELSEAVDAINTGEIFRYINKPWELENLRTDLKNALELAELRAERDGLLREKLYAQHNQLMAQRLTALLSAVAALRPGAQEPALAALVRCAAVCADLASPSVDWRRWDHADLVQAEAHRSAGISANVGAWLQRWSPHASGAPSPQLLADALGTSAECSGAELAVSDPGIFTDLLAGPAGTQPSLAACAWLAWLVRNSGAVELLPSLPGDAEGRWRIRSLPAGSDPPGDWLLSFIDSLALPLPG